MLGKKRLFGLDIGAGSIKLVEMKKSGSRLELVRFRCLDIEPDEDPVRRQQLLVGALNRMVKEEKLKDGWAAVSISGQSAFVKILRLPRMAEKKVDQIIRYEAQQQVPFPINEVIWDYELLDTKGGAEMEVALVAIKTGIISQLLGVLEKAGIDVELINTTTLAMYNLFKFSGGQEKPSVLLDIGARTTNVIIGFGEIIWMRSLPIAGDDFTRALAKGLSLSPAEAENAKKEKGSILLETDSASASREEIRISEAIAPVAADLAGEILNSISYFNTQYKDVIIERMFLAGGSSRLKNLDRFLEANLGFPVKKFDYLSRFAVPGAAGKTIAGDADTLGVAVGLALQARAPVTVGVNLLPEEELKSQSLKKRKDTIFVAEGLAVLTVAALILLNQQNILQKQERLGRLKRQLQQYRQLTEKVNSAEKSLQPVQAKISFLQVINDRRQFYLRILNELAQLLPNDTWLTLLQVQDASEVFGEGGGLTSVGATRLPVDQSQQATVETIIVERKTVSLRGGKERLVLTVSGATRKTLPVVNDLVRNLEASEYFSDVKIVSADYVSPAETTEGLGGYSDIGKSGFPGAGGMGRGTGAAAGKLVVFRLQMQMERNPL